MHQLTFDAKVRIQIPAAEHPNIQSLYVFNMYRAGSSVTEAVALALSDLSNHTSFNPVKTFDDAGVGLIDHQDFSRTSSYIDSTTLSLDQLGRLGGYLYYGFREIPRAYAERFVYIAASVIVARDPRDIGISQYSAVRKHVISGAAGNDIKNLRDTTSRMDLEEFLLSDVTIGFLKRITNCYAPLLARGCTLLRYEEFMGADGFNLAQFTNSVAMAFQPYLELQKPMPQVLARLQRRIDNSLSLKGHATGGRINLYRNLPESTIKKLNEALEPELKMFGYL